jgi:hypothetical protein
MDMLYHLPFRDWLELDRRPAKPAPAADDPEADGTAAIASGAARVTAAHG